MTAGVRIERATSGDADALTLSQIQTFGGEPSGGPSGYGSRAWNRSMVAAAYFYRITVNDTVAGGVIVLRPDWSEFHLARIWVEPSRQSQGVGSRALALVEARFPQATLWTVDVPVWASRRRHFFKLNHYDVVREAHGIVRYEKRRKGILRFNSFG